MMPLESKGQIVRADDSFCVLFRSLWPLHMAQMCFLQFCFRPLPAGHPIVAVSIWRFARGTLRQIQK